MVCMTESCDRSPVTQLQVVAANTIEGRCLESIAIE